MRILIGWGFYGLSTRLDLKQEELQRHKSLTILIGLACEENDVESIRYSELKKLNNDRLSEFTQICKVCKPAR
ncbi:MAG: hypothetical protein ACR2IS_13015 [Nitrososphaeraceae archaeon]